MFYNAVLLVAAAVLGLIPAYIAQKKGYSFGKWWIYGWLLFIVAITHLSLIPDKNAQVQHVPMSSPEANEKASVPLSQMETAAEENAAEDKRAKKLKKVLLIAIAAEAAVLLAAMLVPMVILP